MTIRTGRQCITRIMEQEKGDVVNVINVLGFFILRVTVIIEFTQVRFRPPHLTLTVDIKPSCPYYGLIETI